MQHKYHGMETRHTWSLSLAPHCQEGSGKGRGKQGCTHLWKESQKGGRQTPASSDVSLCLRRMRLRLPLCQCELGLKVLLQTPLILLHEVNAKITSEVWLNIKIYGVLWIKIQWLLLLLPQISRKYKEKKCHVFCFFSWSGFSGIYLLYWPTYYSS